MQDEEQYIREGRRKQSEEQGVKERGGILEERCQKYQVPQKIHQGV